MDTQCFVDTIKDDIVLIIMPEKITMANSQQVFMELKLAGRTPKTILDFAGTHIMDSSGLSALVKYYKTLEDNQFLMLTNLQPTIASLFQLTRMNELFTIAESVPQATRAMAEL